MADYDTIAVERFDGVAVITLNRPDVLNAINARMVDEIDAALDELAADDEIRVLVFTGAGRAFSAGRDVKEIGEASHRSGADLWRKIEDCAKPVIGAVNGLCYTGALSMLLSFDMVIAAEGAVFADTHARFGMRHGGGSTQRLRDAIGPRKAKEMLFTCEPIDATEAHRVGLVNRVVPLDDLLPETLSVANAIAANDPEALRVTKALINEGARLGTAAGLELEQEEYRRQRADVSDGTAVIDVTTD